MHGFTQDGGPEPRLDRVRQDPIDATQSPRRSPRGSAGCPLGSVASTPPPYGSAAGWWRRAESARRGHSAFREVPSYSGRRREADPAGSDASASGSSSSRTKGGTPAPARAYGW